jgi:hypothetical protein
MWRELLFSNARNLTNSWVAKLEIKSVWPSTKVYSRAYARLSFSNLEPMPLVDGQWTECRDFEQDQDDYFSFPKMENIKEIHQLPFVGKKLMQDPIDQPNLHPIEIVIDIDVIKEMHIQSLKACKNSAGEIEPSSRKETGGFLGGKLMRDSNGRCWTHIVKSVHMPDAIGEADQLEVPLEIASQWSQELSNLKLENVGFWHSHPTYEPFQSDSRLAFGADVEATYDKCKAWWKSALVIDPYCGGRTNGKDGQTQLGAYKITKPGISTQQQPLSFNEEGEIMGWRSIGFAINT